MKNVYDNGYYLLGQVDKVIEYCKNNITTSDMEDEFYELMQELTEYYETTDIVSIYYENPMGYTIECWSKEDIVNK